MKKSKVIGAGLAAIVAVELIVRISGITDFPTYNTDSEIGYWPQESQSGNFLGKNDWYFNDKSMPIARNWDPNLRPNILLIGNSIVMGGNPYRQQDKLTSQIQKRLGDLPIVWPAAAGGWTQVNEMIYLDRHPEIVDAEDSFAWEYMAGGLGSATPWGGEYVFPSHRPIYASWYVARRYILTRLFTFETGSELPAVGSAQQSNIARFDRAIRTLKYAGTSFHDGIIWLYPTAAQFNEAQSGKEWLPERPKIKEIAEKYGIKIIDIAASPRWNKSLYRADGVHPTVEGNEVLASILSDELKKDSRN